MKEKVLDLDVVFFAVLSFVSVAAVVSACDSASLADDETAAACEDERAAAPIKKAKIRLGDYTSLCDDGVAEAWYARGWKPGTGATMSLTLPLMDAPKMPTRPRRPTASKIQSGMPTRPKLSAALMRQAELFFGKKN